MDPSKNEIPPFKEKYRGKGQPPFNKHRKVNKLISNTIKKTHEDVKENTGIDLIKYSKNKYKNFVEDVKKSSPEHGNIFRYLPNVLLSLSILASNNRELIKPIILSYIKARKQLDGTSSPQATVAIFLSEYAKIIYNMPVFDSISMSFNALTLFLEDIPSLIRNIKPLAKNQQYLQFSIFSRLIKNIRDVKRDVIDTPVKMLGLEDEAKQAEKKLKDMYEMLKNKKGVVIEDKDKGKGKGEDKLNIKQMHKLVDSLKETYDSSNQKLQKISENYLKNQSEKNKNQSGKNKNQSGKNKNQQSGKNKNQSGKNKNQSEKNKYKFRKTK